MKPTLLEPGKRLVTLIGVLAGACASIATIALAGSELDRAVVDGDPSTLEATHLSPLLTTPGEDVTLAYDSYCVGPEVSNEAEAGCDVSGSVFVRPRGGTSFTEVVLERETPAGGRLVHRVAPALAASGFEYYAVLRAGSGGVTVPAGGAAAPHLSLPLEKAATVDLGEHGFGSTRSAQARVASAKWGDRADEVGLEEGRNLDPVGASAFDVDAAGTVTLLDQAHRRVLRWRPGARAPTHARVSVDGSLADLSVAPDGTIYVLESVARRGQTPALKRFDADGHELEAVQTAERTSSQVRIGPDGPIVLQQPSNQWMPAATAGTPVGPEFQRRHGRPARQLRQGGELTVFRTDNEVRVAHVGPKGIKRSWRVLSRTALAEVQLAEPLGQRLVLVVRVYAENRDEFAVLVLDRDGLVSRASLDSVDWAETAPVGRFRLRGSSLYQLGSTSDGAFVDRYDLDAK